ncbi:hypothetical protein OB919_17220 [Halobacteria archaeon AArc-curdl1]|uniref:Uncharacterized protein n=1 Tax=Natronosalvus hydrolyticus TaxID=2979988 RepID=A0AAP3E7K5_9EURY|nr:hypothetical protein [Halobacteria archaeon AArc-curdl1]
MEGSTGIRFCAVVLLVVLAGCSGAFGDGVERENYGVEATIEPEQSVETDVPGLTTEGVTDWTALWFAHVEYVGGSAYELTRETTYVDSNGSVLYNETVRVTVASDGTERIVQRVETPARHNESDWNETTRMDNRTREQWRIDEVTAVREIRSNESTVHTDRVLTETGTQLPVNPNTLFPAVEDVTTVTTDGSTQYLLTGSGSLLSYQETTFWILIAEEGYVQAFHLEGTRMIDGERVTVTITSTLERVGEPIDLEVPEWVESAGD